VTVTEQVTVPGPTVTVTRKAKPRKVTVTVTAKAPAPVVEPEVVEPEDSGTDPHFGTCGEANDAGYGPYYAGVDEEYGWYTDRDSDGVVCER
jgi:hypothetical protein